MKWCSGSGAFVLASVTFADTCPPENGEGWKTSATNWKLCFLHQVPGLKTKNKNKGFLLANAIAEYISMVPKDVYFYFCLNLSFYSHFQFEFLFCLNLSFIFIFNLKGCSLSGTSKCGLPPCAWGWCRHNGRLLPSVMTFVFDWNML